MVNPYSEASPGASKFKLMVAISGVGHASICTRRQTCTHHSSNQVEYRQPPPTPIRSGPLKSSWHPSTSNFHDIKRYNKAYISYPHTSPLCSPGRHSVSCLSVRRRTCRRISTSPDRTAESEAFRWSFSIGESHEFSESLNLQPRKRGIYSKSILSKGSLERSNRMPG